VTYTLEDGSMIKIWPPRRLVKALYACKGTGLPRIAELIRRVSAKRHPSTCVVINDFFGLKFACHLGEHMGSHIYWRGAYSGAQLKVLANILRPGGVFLDLGANHGEFSVVASRLVGMHGHVFSFEPSPIMRRRLEQNIDLNGLTNINVEPVALANQPGRFDLFAPTNAFRDGTRHDGLPSLYLKKCANRKDIEAMTSVQVDVTTLDEWANTRQRLHVDVIKLDIEGAELPALKGGVSLIKRCRPALIIELNAVTSAAAGYRTEDLVNWLQLHSYELRRIESNGRLPPIVNHDCLKRFQNILAIPN
jgi:FkbM family methyltransferase